MQQRKPTNYTFRLIALIITLGILTVASVEATPTIPQEVLATMPIEEVTVFKDGHAFVLHHGNLPVEPSGKVILNYLPAPVLGTFWPFSADDKAELRAVTAGKHRVVREKIALSTRDLIEANIGARVSITERPATEGVRELPSEYEATILAVPRRPKEENVSQNSESTNVGVSQKGEIVILKTHQGVKALEFDRILDVTFKDPPKDKVAEEVWQNLLTLDLKWQGKPRSQAQIGMVYLQRGLRWIPSYRLDIDDQHGAVLKLEATLINELADLSGVAAHLVIGVPSFAFKDQVDPISLQHDVAELTSNFRPDSRTAFAFSNSIMSQQVNYGPNQGASNPGGTVPNLGPGPTQGEKSEDLYVFTVDHLTLKKGGRMVMPIAEYHLSYEDIYTLTIPFSPPLEVMRNLGPSQRTDLLRQAAGPKVKHKVRLTNHSESPFTTAPAMVLKNGRIVSQGLMTYTPPGKKVDIELTTAIDIGVEKRDHETGRIPNAVTRNGDRYTRIDLEGRITLSNTKDEILTVEIVRYVLGNLDEVGQLGEKLMINPFEDPSYLPETEEWWHGYSWPWWWYHFNGIGRITWTTTLKPDQGAEHTYGWHYLWR